MVRSNFVWCVLCLTAVWCVSVAAQERSDASAVWIDVPPTEVNLGALFQEPPITSGVWIDLGFPVPVRSDGSKFKPLFAPLVMDLDGRIRLSESAPRAVWIDKGFFDRAPVLQPGGTIYIGDLGKPRIIALEAKQLDSKVIETIKIEGGRVEIVGDSIKVDGGKVEITRVTPRL